MAITSAILRELARAGLNADQIVAAVERIEEAEGRPMSGAERTRRWREHRDAVTSDNVTSQSSPARAEPTLVVPSLVSSSEEKQQEEPKESPPKGGQRKGVGSRLPENFEPDIEAAIAEGLTRPEALQEVAKFKDHWRAAAGQRGVKADWPATWRNWFRKALEQRRPSTGPPSNGKPTLGDILRAAQREIAETEDAKFPPDLERQTEPRRIGAHHRDPDQDVDLLSGSSH